MAALLLIVGVLVVLVVLDRPKTRPAPQDDNLIQRLVRLDW